MHLKISSGLASSSQKNDCRWQFWNSDLSTPVQRQNICQLEATCNLPLCRVASFQETQKILLKVSVSDRYSLWFKSLISLKVSLVDTLLRKSPSRKCLLLCLPNFLFNIKYIYFYIIKYMYIFIFRLCGMHTYVQFFSIITVFFSLYLCRSCVFVFCVLN